MQIIIEGSPKEIVALAKELKGQSFRDSLVKFSSEEESRFPFTKENPFCSTDIGRMGYQEHQEETSCESADRTNDID